MNMTWTLGSMAALAAAGFVADKVTALGWRVATGRPVPEDTDDNSTLLQVALFAAASAAVVAVAQHYALRSAEHLFDPTGEKGIRRTPATIEASA